MTERRPTYHIEPGCGVVIGAQRDEPLGMPSEMIPTRAPVKERPILFSGEMVRAILDGRKTQTRRVAELEAALSALVSDEDAGVYDHYYCAYCDMERHHDTDPPQHEPDCPIVKGRALIAVEPSR